MENNQAFPCLIYDESGNTIGYSSGMDLRNYFAIQILQGSLACGKIDRTLSNDELAESCYTLADAMIKQSKL